ncbi:MAG: tetratricopeptide repeat protein [Bacteroidales bacterium]|nr:tetratricopeptide repeat protein [Bacteroidales bacterium]
MKFQTLFYSFALFCVCANAQNTIPQTLQEEENEFKEAIKAVRFDYKNTNQLEHFIYRHPNSRFAGPALVALEKAQILATGTYEYAFEEPTLLQLNNAEQAYHFFYQSQNELATENPDYKKLRNRYEQLLFWDETDTDDEANYYLGYIDYVEGKYDDALEHFKILPPESKYAETVPFYCMQIDYAKGNWDNVLNAINKINVSDLTKEQKLEIDRIKAESLAQKGNTEEAIQLYSKYLDNCDKPLASSAYNCAVLAYNSGNQNLTQKALGKAIENSEGQLKQISYLLLGQSCLLTNDTPKAKMAFNQAANMDADKAVKEAAAYNEAVLMYETAFSIWGDEITMFENFLNNYPNSKYTDNVSTYLTDIYSTTKNYQAALNSISKIKKPTNNILETKQKLYYQLGIQDYVNGDFANANNNFSQCLEVKTNNKEVISNAYYWRGESRYHLNDLSNAAQDYLKVFNNTSDENLKSAADYSLGYVQFKNQNFSEAIKNFEKYASTPSLHGSETYYDALARLGDCAYYSRDFVKAENYYSNVADASCNSSAYALFQQAFMAGLQKKYAQKQTILNNLIAKYSDNVIIDKAWLEKGMTSILQNETNAAINSFKHVVENYPNSSSAPQAAVQLAMAYNNSGQTSKAQEIYKMVAQRYPNTDEATTALQDLKTLSTSALYAEMPKALENGDYQKVLDNYSRLVKENVDFRQLQKMQLLAAKAHLAQGNKTEALDLLAESSKDMRTEAGAEAKYLLAQNLYDNDQVSEAQEQVTELIQAGTQHQYWLARGIILLSDIAEINGDNLTATEYLKSLKENYTNDDDIQKMIESRLK